MTTKPPETKAVSQTAVNCLLSPDGKILFIGKEVNKALEFAQEELTGRDFKSLLHPEDQEIFSSCFFIPYKKTAVVRVRIRSGKYVLTELNPEGNADAAGNVCSFSLPLLFQDKTLPLTPEMTHHSPASGKTETKNQEESYSTNKVAFFAPFFTDKAAGSSFMGGFDPKHYHQALNKFTIIAVTDHKGVITYINENFCKISQYSSQELIGKTHKLINSGHHPASFFKEMWKTISSGGVWKGEICNRAKDDSFYWVSTTIVPFLGEHHTPLRYLAIRQDITEKKRAEASLQESERLYRSLYENHPDLVLMTNPQGLILQSNKNPLAGRFTGGSALSDKNFLNYLSETGRKQVSSKIPDLLSGHTVQLETHVLNTTRPFMGMITIVPFEQKGSITGFFIQVRNISDRIKAEEALRLSNERFQLATKATQDAVLDWDLSENTIYLGDGYNTLFGHNLPSSISADQWITHIHPDDAGKVLEAIFERISSNTNWSIEYRYKCADGTYKFIRDRACVIHNKYHRAIRITGAMSDITEQKTREDLLKGFNAQLEVKVNEKTATLEETLGRMKLEMDARAEADKILQQSVKEKEVLLKEIHHRVKNNMAVISGLLSLQARQAKQEEVKELFKDSQSRIKSMALIHEHLYQHRNLSVINFKNYIQELTEGIARSFNNSSAEVEIQVKGTDQELDINQAVPCGLILNELLTNCFKYAFQGMPKGNICITFTMVQEQFLLQVADNGSGFPAGQDFKSPKTLGLKLVNNLAKQLGGTLTSEIRKGSLFTIVFPAKA